MHYLTQHDPNILWPHLSIKERIRKIKSGRSKEIERVRRDRKREETECIGREIVWEIYWQIN